MRRGSLEDGLYWFVRIMVVAILLILLNVQIGMVLDTRAKIQHIELSLYRERLVFGPHGVLATEERTGRQLHTLDVSKLAAEHLEAAYTQEEQFFAAQFRLYDDADDIGTDNARVTAYQNEAIVETYLPLARAGVTGTGSAFYERRVYPFIADGEPVWLDVEVLKLR